MNLDLQEDTTKITFYDWLIENSAGLGIGNYPGYNIFFFKEDSQLNWINQHIEKILSQIVSRFQTVSDDDEPWSLFRLPTRYFRVISNYEFLVPVIVANFCDEESQEDYRDYVINLYDMYVADMNSKGMKSEKMHLLAYFENRLVKPLTEIS